MRFLKIATSFFIKDKSGWQSSFKFAVGTFFLEMVLASFIFFQISSKVRFRGFFSLENALAFGVVVYFFLRVFFLHLSFGFVLRILEKIFAVQAKKTFYVLFVLYAYLLLAIRYPQNFDELPWVTWLLKSSKVYYSAWICWVPLLGIFGLLLYSLFRHSKAKIFQYGLAALALGGLAVFFYQSLLPLGSQIPEIQGLKTVAKEKRRPNIIFVTVDSMRGDVALEDIAPAESPLQNYLSASVKFDRVISPLAQTHAALASLFLGETPPTTGFRTNLSDRGLKSDEIFASGLLGQVKKAGYEVRIIKDQSEYENISSGKVFDHIESPDFPIANVTISTFFKNRLVYGLFDNPFGYWVLPEIKNNTSFIYSYDLRRFTKNVFEELDHINETEAPVFLYIHSCSLHWPGVLPYPYYPQEGFPEHSQTPFAYTSKFRGLSPVKLSREEWNIQADFDQKIYKAGLSMTVKEFLNPVMEKIEKAGLSENSIIVLMSDHGEELWDSSSRYPKDKLVQHGTSLIFSSSSELSFLRMRIPGVSKVEIAENVGLIDILPTVVDYANLPTTSTEGRSLKPLLSEQQKTKEHFYYTETGLWPFEMFTGQFTTLPAKELGPLFKIDSHGRIYIDPLFLAGIVQQKQRAIYYDSYRFTTYPTEYGFKDFLCDRKKDFHCEENLIGKLPELSKKMKSALNEYFSKDVKAGLLKLGPCSTLGLGQQSMSFEKMKEYQWQYYFQGLECLRNYHDYQYVTEVFEKLLQSDEVAQALKNRIKKTVLSMCAEAGVYSGETIPSYFITGIKEKIESDEDATLGWMTRKCLENIGQSKLAVNLEIDNSELIKEGSRREFRVLLQKYAVAKGDEQAQLWNELNLHPQAKFFITSLDVAKIYSSAGQSYRLLQEGLDQYFRVELNYDLADYLERFYFARMRSFLAYDPDQALVLMLQELASGRSLPLPYYNFLLFRIDEITSGKTSQNLTSLRFDISFRSKRLKAEPMNLKKIEVAAALNEGQRYLCGKKPGSHVCREAMALTQSSQ